VTALATALGTLAALGLSRSRFPMRASVMALLISPIVVPVVITAVGMYFFYAMIGLTNSYLGVILAHTTLATPFVVITVTATLSGFDYNLTRAGASLGASPARVFFKVILPLILPGVISGSLFAFVTSWDEVVVLLFIASPDQRTLPKQMFSGIREQISPTMTAAATLLILCSIVLLTTVELLRRRAERLRGIRA
jgi:putative spermidine/putrescine transport system permease protein